MVNEHGESGGNSHVEAICKLPTQSTNNVTRRFHRLYQQMGLELTHQAIRVKKASHLVGALIYTAKELKTTGKLMVIKGWTQTWIDKQIKENVSDIPYKMLKGMGHRLTQQVAGATMYEYAKAHNMQVTSKQEYSSVAKLMAKDRYLFGTLRHIGVYQDVSSLFGSGEAVENVIDSQLAFV